MAQSKDLYTVLGVSPGASTSEIRAQYRKLVREYHPDIAVDKLVAHERLVEIVDAYQTLSDEERRGRYDAVRKMHVRPPQSVQYSWKDELRRNSVDSLIRIAELFFIRGQYNQAIAECRRVISMDPKNASAHGLLGDLLRKMGKRDEALHAYTIAAQLTDRPKLYQLKIDELMEGKDDVEDSSRTAPSPIATSVGVSALASSIIPVAVLLRTDRTFLWSDLFPAGSLVMAATACAFLVGVSMALLRWLEHADEELFQGTFEKSGSIFPIGAWLIAMSVFWFYLAVLSYVVIALFEEHISPSIVKAFGASLAVMAVFAILMPNEYSKVFTFGGNAVFPSLLVGWSIGSMGRPRWS